MDVPGFGKAGRHYYRIVRSQDERPVSPNRIRKSIGAERTYSENIKELSVMKEKLAFLTEKVFDYMKKTHNFGRTVTIKMKTPEFQIFTRSRSFNSEVRKLGEHRKVVFALLEENIAEVGEVRLLGISVSNLEREQEADGVQLIEFPEEEE